MCILLEIMRIMDYHLNVSLSIFQSHFEEPYVTIQYGLSQMVQDDLLQLLPGIYEGPGNVDVLVSAKNRFTIQASGEPEICHFLTLSVVGSVVIAGSGNDTWFIENIDEADFIGLAFHGVRLHIENSSVLQFNNCSFSRVDNNAVRLDMCDEIDFNYCSFTDNGYGRYTADFFEVLTHPQVRDLMVEQFIQRLE